MSNNIFFDLSELKYCGKNVIIGKTVRIRNPELVEIGDNCIIDDFTYISGKVILGRGVHIGANSTFQAGKSSIKIDNYSGISSGCRFFAVSSDYLASEIDLPTLPIDFIIENKSTINENIEVGEACLIGANSIVLPGVTIPNGSSFGAASKISNRNYEEFSFYLNDCKKVIAKRNKQKIINLLNKLKKYD